MPVCVCVLFIHNFWSADWQNIVKSEEEEKKIEELDVNKGMPSRFRHCIHYSQCVIVLSFFIHIDQNEFRTLSQKSTSLVLNRTVYHKNLQLVSLVNCCLENQTYFDGDMVGRHSLNPSSVYLFLCWLGLICLFFHY